jgi:hypothetical protein
MGNEIFRPIDPETAKAISDTVKLGSDVGARWKMNCFSVSRIKQCVVSWLRRKNLSGPN